MFQVLSSSWALLLGLFMLMIGNGLQGTLLGLRGELEGFSTLEMSMIMSAYFVGFLFASRIAPTLIRRVGHIRVFAALGSTISAVLILYPTLTEPWAWMVGRLLIGFCFCGVYITSESWLNDAASNENRGKALSLYMITQMSAIILAQYLVMLGDVSGFVLFIIPSVLVSLSFAPILLSVRPVPAFETTKPLSLRQLISASPLACMGMFLLGGVFAAQFGMSAVYGSRVGLTVSEISVMVSSIYVMALFLQYPVGWLSDRMDRRLLIIILALFGGTGAVMSFIFPNHYWLILVSAAIVGGATNPLYALLIAYANDYLDRSDMAAASAGFLFINGLGAIGGPLILGWVMTSVSAEAFWLYVGSQLLALGFYGMWRMTRRKSATAVSETVSYAPILASATPVAVEVAQEVYIEAELEESEGNKE